MSDSAEEREYLRAAQLAYAEITERLGEGVPQPRLEPTRRVVELLGDVHRSYPVIHVAGTNGKTSTSRMIEAILRAYGLRTGLFTSPHLVAVNERIQIDGVPIANDAFVANWLDIKPYIDMVDAELETSNEPKLTYFEVLSILAFACFADAPVDVAVVEVGLGGEWDSTNVADAVVSVFTPIDLDHTNRLGATVREIALTKSGIIKPSALVVSAAQSDEAREVLVNGAELTESTIAFLGSGSLGVTTTMAVGGQQISVAGQAARYDDLFLGLYGTHQAENAALAVIAVEAFLGGAAQQLDPAVLAEALATVQSPGRLQLVGSDPTVLVDAAHNPHGAKALAEALDEFFTFDDVTFVIGTLDDKDSAGIITRLAEVASRFIVVPVNSERASAVSDVVEVCQNVAPHIAASTTNTVAEGIAQARAYASAEDKGAVVVTGSIVLVGQALQVAELTEGWTK